MAIGGIHTLVPRLRLVQPLPRPGEERRSGQNVVLAVTNEHGGTPPRRGRLNDPSLTPFGEPGGGALGGRRLVVLGPKLRGELRDVARATAQIGFQRCELRTQVLHEL
jgi:hypothetical protein